MVEIDHQIVAELTNQPPEIIANSPPAQAIGRLLIHDGLTGLYNRRYLQARLARELERTTVGRELSLLLMDLDGFKRINDTMGHATGDQLLVAAAKAIGELMPPEGFACRYGGDEFVMVLPGWAGADAEGWARSLLHSFSGGAIELEGAGQATLSGSIGIATAPADAVDFANLVARADEAMYRVKHRAGGEPCRFSQIRKEHTLKGQIRSTWEIPFVGREAECGEILNAATAGKRIYLHGPAGIGKSRLAAEMAERARQMGWVDVTAHGIAPVPLGGLRQLVEALSKRADQWDDLARERLAQVREWMEEPQQGSEGQEVVVAELAHLLPALGEKRPLWLSLDDVQLWDEGSLRLLQRLNVTPGSSHFVLCATWDWEDERRGSQPLHDIEQMQMGGMPVRVLELPPLSEQECERLVQAVLPGAFEEALLHHLRDACGGHPLLLTTLLLEWLREDRLVNSLGRWTVTWLPEHPRQMRLAETILEEIGDMSPEAQELLFALSVTPVAWSLRDICRVCGAVEAELSPWLEDARLRGLLRAEDGWWRFVNAEIRHMFFAKQPELSRRAWSRLAAMALGELGRCGSAEIAALWELSGERHTAVEWHARAAEEAERYGALSRSGHHHRKAAELSTGMSAFDGVRTTWWHRAGNALQKVGRLEESEHCLIQALGPEIAPEEKAAILDDLAVCLMLMDQSELVQGCLDEAERLIHDCSPSPLLGRIVGHRAFLVGSFYADYPMAIRLCHQAVAILEQFGPGPTLAHLYDVLGENYHRMGRYRVGLRWFTKSIEIRCASPDWLPGFSIYHPDPVRRIELLTPALERFERKGLYTDVSFTASHLVGALVAAGRWEQAEAVHELRVRFAWAQGVTWVGIAHADWAFHLIHHDRIDEAEVLVDRALVFLPDPEVALNYYDAMAARVSLLIAWGRPERALSVGAAALGEPLRYGWYTMQLYLAMADAAAEMGDVSQVDRWINDADRCGRGNANCATDGRIAVLRGRAAELGGQHTEALTCYRRARRSLFRPWDRIESLIRETRLAVEVGAEPRSRSRARARQALRLARHQGYPALVRQAEALVQVCNQSAVRG